MKKLVHVFLAALILVAGAEFARSQDTITPERTALVKELMEASGGKKQFDDLTSSMLDMQTDTASQAFDAVFADDKTLTAADRAMIKDLMAESINRMMAKSKEFFAEKLNFDKMVENVFTPVYAKHFTDEDLRAMIAFYRTPTGQKTVKEMPQMMSELGISISKTIMPDYMEFMNATIEAEKTAIKQKLKPKKAARAS